MATNRKVQVVDGEVVDEEGNLFAELVAAVRVPEPLVVVPGKLVASYPPARRVNQLLVAISIDDQIRAVFGDDYALAEELFGSQPLAVWNKFMERYNEHFFGDKDSGK